MKIKINKFLLGITLIFSLLVTSCNDFQEEEKSSATPSVAAKSTIKLSLESDYLRTAFPEINVEKITEFTLGGIHYDSSDSADTSFSKSWTSGVEKTAYELMIADELPVVDGKWEFGLSATAKDGDLTLATYSGIKTVTIGSGQNALAFKLTLQSVNVNSSAGSGKLAISIKLSESVKVKAITATLLKSDKSVKLSSSDITINDENNDGFADAGAYSYTVDSLEAGSYIAQIDFYSDAEKKSLVGSWPEAVNINSLGATSTININNLEKAYDIGYYQYLIGSESSAPQAIDSESGTTNANQVSYNRRSSFTLAEPSHEGWEFWKWVQLDSAASSVDTSGAAVTEVAKNTIGERKYCAIFVRAVDAAEITSVEVQAQEDSELKIGTTIKIQPKSGDENFTGSAIYNWYWKNEGTTIDGSYIKYELTGSEKTLLVKAELASRPYVAVAAPKYLISRDEDGKITNVKENQAINPGEEGFEASKAKVSAKFTPVSGDVKPVGLYLKYKTTVERGKTFNIPNESPDIEILSSSSEEEGYFEDVNSGEKYYLSQIIRFVIIGGDLTAPASSGIITDSQKLTTRLDGLGVKIGDKNIYTAYGMVSVPDVFVSVKYATPSDQTTDLPVLSTSDYSITYGKMKFASVGENETVKYMYAIASGSDSPAADSWKDVTTDEFSVPASGTFSIYVKYKASGTAGTEGYIADSDPYRLKTIDWDTAGAATVENSGLGKKVVLGSVTLSGDAKVGSTLTATVAPDIAGTDISYLDSAYGTLTWKWYACDDSNPDGTLIETRSGRHEPTETLTIYDVNAWFNKKVKLVVEYVYKKDGSNTSISKSPETSPLVEKGDLTIVKTTESEITAVYNRVSSIAGTSLAFAGFTLNELKNALGQSVWPEASDCTFEPAAPSVNSEVSIKVNIYGYKEVVLKAIVPVRKAAPEIKSDTNEDAPSILSDKAGQIPYGMIWFQSESEDIKLSELEFSYVGSAESWHDLPTDRGIYDGNYTALWNDASLTDLNYFSQNDCIFVRYKAVGGPSALGSVGASDMVTVTVGSSNVGSLKANFTVSVVDESDIILTSTDSGFVVSNASDTASFKWFIDGQEISGKTGASLSLSDISSELTPVAGKYTIRVETVNGFGETLTASGTLTIASGN